MVSGFSGSVAKSVTKSEQTVPVTGSYRVTVSVGVNRWVENCRVTAHAPLFQNPKIQ
jgi:hypothetical protein